MGKTHRLYLEIPYLYLGITHQYRPDFVVRLTSGLMVLVEGKGDPDEKDDAKATAEPPAPVEQTFGTLPHGHGPRRKRTYEVSSY